MNLLRALRRFALALLALSPLAAPAAAPAGSAEELETGRSIYLQGRLPDGRPVRATRLGVDVGGAAAACAQCHRRSGLGIVEGDQAIAPITGRALFGAARSVVTAMDPVRGKALSQSHDPYTEAQVAAAIREGRHPGGRAMHELMPRYALDDGAMRALLAYLRTLSTEWSPGADDKTLRFATVVTPDVDPARRAAFLETLQTAFLQKNGATMPGKRHMVMAGEFAMVTERRWELERWELNGEPASWPAQLDALYKATPVFAIVSGLGRNWQPVHAFCERQAVPCWFPSVPAAPADDGQWSLYFSAGARLEAQVLADRIAALPGAPRRIVQWLGDSPAAVAAAAVLAAELKASRIAVQSVAPAQWAQSAASLRADDLLVGWLEPADYARLAGLAAPAAPGYWSTSLGGERLALPAAWKPAARVLYPYELPAQRAANLAFFRSWAAQRGIAVVDEPMQSEVYFAVNYLRDTLGEMFNNLHRDYLVERAESMLSLRESRKANEEMLARQSLRQRYVHRVDAQPTGVLAAYQDGRRTGTTAYPALGLGPGQRLASKGAYIARYAGPASDELVAETAWLVP